QPQPPNTPARQRGHTKRPAARSASTTARSSETMSTTTSNGVTGSLANSRFKVSAREPNTNRNTTILSPATPQERSPSSRSVALPRSRRPTQRVAQQGQSQGHSPSRAQAVAGNIPLTRKQPNLTAQSHGQLRRGRLRHRGRRDRAGAAARPPD